LFFPARAARIARAAAELPIPRCHGIGWFHHRGVVRADRTGGVTAHPAFFSASSWNPRCAAAVELPRVAPSVIAQNGIRSSANNGEEGIGKPRT